MPDKLAEPDLLRALQALAARRTTPTQLILGGAGALILTGELPRATSDCDVLYSTPDMGALQEDIRAVAQQLGLPAGWLNGSIQSYLDILPADYRDRLRTLAIPGRLQVAVLHRRDVLVMKFYAGRPRDLADIEQLAPSRAELDFVRSQLPRLEAIHPARAARVSAALSSYD